MVRSKKAPLVEEEYFSDESVEYVKSKKSAKKLNPKKSRRKETEDKTTNENNNKEKKIEDDLTEAIAIVYKIDDPKHPFNDLNGVPGSIEISKIWSFDKKNVNLK
jgi:hypothetical protein